MQPTRVVIALDELLHVGVQVIEIGIGIGVDLFALKGFEEALTTRIVERVPRSAHTGQHLVFVQDCNVVAAGILHPAIGVMH